MPVARDIATNEVGSKDMCNGASKAPTSMQAAVADLQRDGLTYREIAGVLRMGSQRTPESRIYRMRRRCQRVAESQRRERLYQPHLFNF